VCFYGICERHSFRLSVDHPMHNCGTRADRIGSKSIWCYDWILPAAGWRAQPFTAYKENFKISQSFDTFWARGEKPMWKFDWQQDWKLQSHILAHSPILNGDSWSWFSAWSLCQCEHLDTQGSCLTGLMCGQWLSLEGWFVGHDTGSWMSLSKYSMVRVSCNLIDCIYLHICNIFTKTCSLS
jgi:hypothetical protein